MSSQIASAPRNDGGYRSLYQARNWGATPMDTMPDNAHDSSLHHQQHQHPQQHSGSIHKAAADSAFNGYLHLNGGHHDHSGHALPPGIPALQLSGAGAAAYARPEQQHWGTLSHQPSQWASPDMAPLFTAAPPSCMLSHDTTALLSMLRPLNHDLFPSSQLSRSDPYRSSAGVPLPSHQLPSHQRRSSSPGFHTGSQQPAGPAAQQQQQQQAPPPQPQAAPPLPQQPQQGSEEGMRRAVQLQIILLMQKEQDKSQQGWLQELFDMTNASTMPVLCTLRRQLDVLLQPLPKAAAGSSGAQAASAATPAPTSVDWRADGPFDAVRHGSGSSSHTLSLSHLSHLPPPRMLDTSGANLALAGNHSSLSRLMDGTPRVGGLSHHGPPSSGNMPGGLMIDSATQFARTSALFANTGPPHPAAAFASAGGSGGHLPFATLHHAHSFPTPQPQPFMNTVGAGALSLGEVRSGTTPHHAPGGPPPYPPGFPSSAYDQHHQLHHQQQHEELHRSLSHPADALGSFDSRGVRMDDGGGGGGAREHPQLQQAARGPALMVEARQRKNVFTMTIEEIVKKMQSGDMASMNPAAILASTRPPLTPLERSASADCGDRIISADKIQKVYDKPLKEAAKLLSVSIMSLKRTCRKMGVSRWPYRKLASLSELEVTVRDDQLEQQLQPSDKQAVMQYIQAEKARIIVEPDRDVDPMLHNLRKAKIHMKYEKWGRKSLNRASSNATALEHVSRSPSPGEDDGDDV